MNCTVKKDREKNRELMRKIVNKEVKKTVFFIILKTKKIDNEKIECHTDKVL